MVRLVRFARRRGRTRLGVLGVGALGASGLGGRGLGGRGLGDGVSAFSFRVLAVSKNDRAFKKTAIRVHNRGSPSAGPPGFEADGAEGAGRRSHQNSTKHFLVGLDGFGITALVESLDDLSGKGRSKILVECLAGGRADLQARRITTFFQPPGQQECNHLVFRQQDFVAQSCFLHRAANRHHLTPGDLAYFRAVSDQRAVLAFAAIGCFGIAIDDDLCFLPHQFSHALAYLGVFGQLPGQNRSRAPESLPRIGDPAFRVDVLFGDLFDILAFVCLLADDPGQRLQARLDCLIGRRATARLVRQIEIVEFPAIHRRLDPLANFRRELIPPPDGGENRYPPVLQVEELPQPVLDGANLDLTQSEAKIGAMVGQKSGRRPVLKLLHQLGKIRESYVRFLGNLQVG